MPQGERSCGNSAMLIVGWPAEGGAAFDDAGGGTGGALGAADETGLPLSCAIAEGTGAAATANATAKATNKPGRRVKLSKAFPRHDVR